MSPALLTSEIRVVRRVDEIVRQRMRHIFVEIQLLGRNDGVVVAEQISQKSRRRQVTCVKARK